MTTQGETTPPYARPASRLPVAVSVLGGSLVLAAVLVAGSLVSNRPRDFNVSGFLVALVGTLLLLAAAAVVGLLGRGLRFGLPAVLGAFGLVGVAIVELSSLSPRHDSWPVYLAGVFLVAAGALGWWLLRGSAMLLVAGLGGLLLLGQVSSDALDGASPQDGQGAVLSVALAFAAFGVAFAAGLWWLPSRHVTGLAGTAFALLAMVIGQYVMLVVGISNAVSSFDQDGKPVREGVGVSWYAVTGLVIGLILCAAALALWALTGHLGYAALGSTGAVAMTVAGAAAVEPDATLRWATGIGVLGALAMAVAVAPALRQRLGHLGGRQPERAGDDLIGPGR